MADGVTSIVQGLEAGYISMSNSHIFFTSSYYFISNRFTILHKYLVWALLANFHHLLFLRQMKLGDVNKYQEEVPSCQDSDTPSNFDGLYK